MKRSYYISRFVSIIVLNALIISISMLAACGTENSGKLFCHHDYASATCTLPETCSRCGKTRGEALGHLWNTVSSCSEPRVCRFCGEIDSTKRSHHWMCYKYSEEIKCLYCKEVITPDSIKAKHGTGIVSVKKAFIYMWLDYYLTAQNSNGKYKYSESQAFSTVQEMFGVSRDYLNNQIWNGHAWSDYNSYYN